MFAVLHIGSYHGYFVVVACFHVGYVLGYGVGVV